MDFHSLVFIKTWKKLLKNLFWDWFNFILRDPGAESGGEEKPKWAEK